MNDDTPATKADLAQQEDRLLQRIERVETNLLSALCCDASGSEARQKATSALAQLRDRLK